MGFIVHNHMVNKVVVLFSHHLNINMNLATSDIPSVLMDELIAPCMCTCVDVSACLCGLVGGMLDHISLPPEFKSRHRHI